MRSRHYLPLLKIFEVFANLIIAIGITNTNYRKCSHIFDNIKIKPKKKKHRNNRDASSFCFIDISIANNYLNCKGDFPKERVTITHKAKLEQAKAEITPKKKLFQTIIILLFSRIQNSSSTSHNVSGLF